MPKLNTNSLLKEIQSGDLEEVYILVSNKAIEWALAGFIEDANLLLTRLWSYNLPHSGHLWLPDEGLQVMWEVTNTKPVGIPFILKSVKDIETSNWNNLMCPSYHESFLQTFRDRNIEELTGVALYGKAILASYEKTETPAVILKALEKFLQSEEAIGNLYAKASASAALFAAKNKLTASAENFIRLWGKGYFKYWANYDRSWLLRDTNTAYLLSTGILADTFNLSKEICRRDYQEITLALSERLNKGRSLVYGNLSWKQLLEKISEVSILQNDVDFPPEIIESKWLGKPPATVTELENAEKSLGIKLPEDYKEFLLTTNGFESISITGVTLAPIDKIDLLININRQLVEIWTSNLNDKIFNKNFSESIVVGGQGEEQQLLLVPLENNNWECWFFAAWMPGETKYPNFRFYMEEQLQNLENDHDND
jgi:cell wall assembly regulator SMI1